MSLLISKSLNSKMKLAVLVFICGVVTMGSVQSKLIFARHGLPPADPPSTRAATPIWGTILQKLDHFDEYNTDIWNMRYLSNGQFFTPGGPIFIMLGAEWTIDDGYLKAGQMFDMAKNHGGYMFYTEHRFYGKSYPTSDMSPPNLKYLTTELALADVEYFINQMKVLHPELADSKVVVVGGSYGGNMAIWMREKYPNVVHAAVSSSAPVLAKVDFYEYDEVVESGLGSDCSSIIRNGIDAVRDLFKTPEGAAKVAKDFNLCEPLDVNNADEVNYFFSAIAITFGGIVQYAGASDIYVTCIQLQYPTTSNDYERLASFIKTKHGKDCVGGYNNMKEQMMHWYYNSQQARQWTYQTCTEFGFFQTSSSSSSMYRDTIPIEMYYRWCSEFYGAEFTPDVVRNGVANTNKFFGGLNPNVTRVVSVQGTVDPWHKLGLSATLNPSMPVIMVEGTSHCADLKSISNSDNEEMKNAKKQVQSYIAKWITEE